MTILSPPLIRKNESISYIDNLLIQVITKRQVFDRFRYLHETLSKSNVKAAPDKTYFFPATVECLGYVITKNKIRPLLDKVGAILQTKRAESKKIVMKMFGVLNYYSKYFPNMLVNLAFLYTLLHVDNFFQWNKERETVFLQVKQRLTQHCEMTTFFVMVDAFAMGFGTVLVQVYGKRQKQDMFSNSRNFTENEQKNAVIYRDLAAKFTQ